MSATTPTDDSSTHALGSRTSAPTSDSSVPAPPQPLEEFFVSDIAPTADQPGRSFSLETFAQDIASRSQSYGETLEAAEAVPNEERSEPDRLFLQSHQDLCRILEEKLIIAENATIAGHMPCKADAQIDYLLWMTRAVYLWSSLNLEKTRAALRTNVDHRQRIEAVVEWIGHEIFCTLRELEQELPRPDEADEYENVGPEHDTTAIGVIVPWPELTDEQHDMRRETGRVDLALDDHDRDHRMRCTICMDEYSSDDLPLRLNACAHIIGQACLSVWLNGTEVQANTCPYCRTRLCDRRERRPKPMAPEREQKIQKLVSFLGKLGKTFGKVQGIVRWSFGGDEEEVRRYGREMLVKVNSSCEQWGIGLRVATQYVAT
ncbi:hypothetical protein BDV95DRAFT_105258 [Massariosphaeria phaeospora]|uniref:RING-type domain-containing protein n=1 Tax=Massariosphaeria phaeospora TaxID=100035 RepID=A0A7C8I248_9PLEO|nr:hypothetical protein BDV95DRAFT_105258 [Massariosphaeria phaeospora]